MTLNPFDEMLATQEAQGVLEWVTVGVLLGITVFLLLLITGVINIDNDDRTPPF